MFASLRQRCYEMIPDCATWGEVAARAGLDTKPNETLRQRGSRAQRYAQRHAIAYGLPWPHPEATMRRSGRPPTARSRHSKRDRYDAAHALLKPTGKKR